MSDGYFGTSLQQLKRIPKELSANLADLVKTYGPAAARTGAGMVPGAGYVDASEDFGRGAQDVLAKRYGSAAANYTQGAINAGLETFLPMLPSLAVVGAPGKFARAGDEVADTSRLVGPNGKPMEIPAKTTYDIPASDRSKQLQGMYEPTTELLPQKTISIEDLQRQNAVIIPMPGDKTDAGRRIIGVNGRRFETPVDQLGGLNFSRAEAAQGPNPSGWASTAQGAKPLLSRTERVAEETGRDPVWAYYPLGDKSSDFTRQGWRTYEQLLRQNGGEQGVAKLSEGLPFGPSLEEMRNWYETTTGGERSKVFKQIAKTKGRLEAGGVDPDDVRRLLQDPALARANEGDIGYGFVRPTGTITDTPSFKHYDYSHHLGGENIGRFEPGTEVPFSTAFPDVFAQNPGWHDLQPQGVSHGVKTKMPYQVVDQELVDRIMKQQELQRMYGGQWQTGGGQR